VSFRIQIREEGLADMDEAAAWYEEQQAGLGSDFVRAIRTAVNSLPANPPDPSTSQSPFQCPVVSAPRFPYRIFYQVRGDLITVFAVIHAARHDRHWQQRA
jgi:plasmid stabilization system protein ParE